jgi:SAM-dependent methyltransferase
VKPPGRIVFQTGDLLTMAFQNQFDLAIAVDVMEHIEDDHRVLANIGRALKPGGLFMLTTPYFAEAIQGQKPANPVFVDEHVRPGYSRTELQEKLADAGLTLERFVITYGSWGRIAWLLLQRGPMRWLSGRPWLLPLVAVYFCLAYPLAWCFMQMDMRTANQNGGGILAIARKAAR